MKSESFLYKYQLNITAGIVNKALIVKNIGQDVISNTCPEVDANTSRANPGKEESSAYCVAVYPLLHIIDINAIITVVAIPEDKFSRVIVNIRKSTLCPT